MNILRLSTLSLTLAITVFAFGYTNPAFADKPPHSHGGGEDPGGLTFTVELKGPTPSLRGAFEFNGGPAVSATLKSKGNELRGDADVEMVRPANADANAQVVWDQVFNLCDLLNEIPDFLALSGDWAVSRSSERQFIRFGFELDASLSDLTDNPLSASLHLSRTCASVAECSAIIPTAPGEASVLMTDYAIHLKGKGGVTHKALCHASDGYPGPIPLSDVAYGSTLVITAE